MGTYQPPVLNRRLGRQLPGAGGGKEDAGVAAATCRFGLWAMARVRKGSDKFIRAF